MHCCVNGGLAPTRSYPSDIKDDEWAFAAPYLALVREDAPQRRHPLRDLFNARRLLLWVEILYQPVTALYLLVLGRTPRYTALHPGTHRGVYETHLLGAFRKR